MSLQTDQASKLAKRAAAHAQQLSNAAMPASAVTPIQTDTLTIIAVKPDNYPSPPF